MKTKFQTTQKTGARFVAALAAAAVAGSTLVACSSPQSDAPADNVALPPMPAENAAAPALEKPMGKMSGEKMASPKTYRDVRGQIVAINAPEKGVAGAKITATFDHEEIPDFMRAMRMTVPFKNADDAKKLKPGGKIVCDFVLENGSLVLGNVRALSADAKLKLAPA